MNVYEWFGMLVCFVGSMVVVVPSWFSSLAFCFKRKQIRKAKMLSKKPESFVSRSTPFSNL